MGDVVLKHTSSQKVEELSPVNETRDEIEENEIIKNLDQQQQQQKQQLKQEQEQQQQQQEQQHLQQQQHHQQHLQQQQQHQQQQQKQQKDWNGKTINLAFTKKYPSYLLSIFCALPVFFYFLSFTEGDGRVAISGYSLYISELILVNRYTKTNRAGGKLNVSLQN